MGAVEFIYSLTFSLPQIVDDGSKWNIHIFLAQIQLDMVILNDVFLASAVLKKTEQPIVLGMR